MIHCMKTVHFLKLTLRDLLFLALKYRRKLFETHFLMQVTVTAYQLSRIHRLISS
jgi:hypothetical protein